MRILLTILALASPLLAHSIEPASTSYNRVHLTASATGSVENDTMKAVLRAQEEGENTAQLADQVNQRVSWGVERVKKYPSLKVETKSYSTQPLYYKNKITGWRVSQSISIESRKSEEELSQLLSVLQERLDLQQISFEISPEKRRMSEDNLIVEAIAAFESRAKIVTTELGFDQYRIVNVQVGASGGSPVYRRPAMAMSMERASADMAPPSIEAGESQLTVSINGEIEGY